MSAISVIRAFVRRDWTTDLSYRAAFALDIAAIVLTLALFFYLGRVVDNQKFATDQNLEGGYFGYVVVGLALLEIVQVGLATFSRKLRDEQTTGTLEALMSTPTSTWLIVLSSAIYDLLRATIGGAIVVAVAVVFFGLSLDTSPLPLAGSLAATAGCVALFGSLGIAIAAFTMVFKRATGLLGLVVTGLALLGGVYFPITVLPNWIESIANILPFTWGLDVARAGLLGGDVDWLRLGGLFAADAILVPAALLLFGSSARHARRRGTLAQY